MTDEISNTLIAGGEESIAAPGPSSSTTHNQGQSVNNLQTPPSTTSRYTASKRKPTDMEVLDWWINNPDFPDFPGMKAFKRAKERGAFVFAPTTLESKITARQNEINLLRQKFLELNAEQEILMTNDNELPPDDLLEARQALHRQAEALHMEETEIVQSLYEMCDEAKKIKEKRRAELEADGAEEDGIKQLEDLGVEGGEATKLEDAMATTDFDHTSSTGEDFVGAMEVGSDGTMEMEGGSDGTMEGEGEDEGDDDDEEGEGDDEDEEEDDEGGERDEEGVEGEDD